LRAQRARDERHLRGRVRVRETAADRAALTDREMADSRGGFGEQRTCIAHIGARGDIMVARHRADAQHLLVTLDARDIGHSRQIDEMRRSSKTHVHHWRQRLAARDDLCVESELREKRERLFD
jgi:hypothetical protein